MSFIPAGACRLLVASTLLPLFATLRAQQTSAPPAAATAKPAATSVVHATRGPSVEGITEYSLPNGLRVLLFPDSSKPTTTVNITYLVGSRMEGYGETGMAHLLEHMLFKGTPRHRNIPQELTEHGANPNGSTWLDRTNYFETFKATDSNLVWALDLEADRMVNSYVAKKDLESEFSVVRNEFESGENDPFRILMERVLSTMYLWHNYGHSTIGARSDIEQVPIERLQGFYHKYYEPDNAVLVLAGKFDEARGLRLVEQKFGRIPRPKRVGELKIWPTYTRDPVQDGERSVTLRRTGDVQVLIAGYHVPAGAHADFPAVDVLTRVLGEQPSGRLYKALVEPKKAAEVGAFNLQNKEPGVLLAFARVRREDSIGPAREALQAALTEVVSSPPSVEEVERAKTQITKDFELLLNNSEESALNLTEWAAVGDWRMLFLHRDRIKQVTAADVQRVAAAYLKPSNATFGTFVPTEKPDRAEIPPDPDVAALVRDYKGDTTLAAGEVFDPSPANIDLRTQRTTLPGGVKLALLPKKTRGQSVNANLTLRFGTLESLQNKGAAPDFAADMLLRGTRTLTRQQIKDSLDRLKARVGITGSVSQVNIRVETTGPNLVPTLNLVGEVLRNPAFDAKEFEELKRQNLAALDEQKSDPQAVAFNSFSRYLAPYPKGDPRYIPTIEESVADYTSATVDDAKRFYLEYYGASDGEIALVGDFDPQQVTAVLGSILGSWKSPKSYSRIETRFNDVPATNISLETPDKANAMYIAGVNLNLRDDDPDYPALLLANEILGGGFLNSRLATRIRQKDGVSYGVGSFVNAGPFDHAGQFIGYAIYAPENVAKVEAGFREEIERARKDGLTSDEIEKARAGMLQNRQVERSDDGALSRALGSELRAGRTMTFDANFEQRLAALTPAAVNEALRKYIDPARITVVKAGDFAKAAPAPPQP
jgi:zinc protease